MFVFQGKDEMLIGINREKIIKEYFEKGGRNIEDYDEYETVEEDEVIEIATQIHVFANMNYKG